MSMGVKRLTKLEVLASWKLFGYFHLSFQESLVVERDSFNATLWAYNKEKDHGDFSSTVMR